MESWDHSIYTGSGATAAFSTCPMCLKHRIDAGIYVGAPPQGGFCAGHRVEDVLKWAGGTS